jgi:hypothetical protein
VVNRTLGPAAIALAILCLITAGCGGGVATGTDQSAAVQQGATGANPGVGQRGTGQGPAGMDGVGLPVVEELMPELAAVPTPEGAGFVTGTAYTADQDPRQTAIQDAYTDLTVSDATAFYQDALPAAAFAITRIDQGTEVIISIVDPDGHEGDIDIAPSAPGPPTRIHIQLYRARTVEVSPSPAEAPGTSTTQISAVLNLDGNTYEMSPGAGDCVIGAAEISVALSFSSGSVTAVGAPSGGWIQASLQSGELWTGGLTAESPPARFDVSGTSVTWAGLMVETASSRQADGSLTIEC